MDVSSSIKRKNQRTWNILDHKTELFFMFWYITWSPGEYVTWFLSRLKYRVLASKSRNNILYIFERSRLWTNFVSSTCSQTWHSEFLLFLLSVTIARLFEMCRQRIVRFWSRAWKCAFFRLLTFGCLSTTIYVSYLYRDR